MRALITHLLVRKQAAMAAASHIPPLSGFWSVPTCLVMPAGSKYLASQCGQVSSGFGCGQKHIKVRDFDAWELRLFGLILEWCTCLTCQTPESVHGSNHRALLLVRHGPWGISDLIKNVTNPLLFRHVRIHTAYTTDVIVTVLRTFKKML